jgi:hypothetical protein
MDKLLPHEMFISQNKYCAYSKQYIHNALITIFQPTMSSKLLQLSTYPIVAFQPTLPNANSPIPTLRGIGLASYIANQGLPT